MSFYGIRRNGSQSKYGNKKVTCFGITFDSSRERDRYLVLREAQEKGIITNLKLQERFELLPAIKESVVTHHKTKDNIEERTVQLPITYKCDFQYEKDGVVVVEDVKISKSLIPKEFALKEKMFRYKYGFPIRKVFKANEPI